MHCPVDVRGWPVPSQYRRCAMNFKKWFKQLMVGLLSLTIVGGPALAARTTTYFHTDGAGSVVAATNDAGAVLWRKDYAPFGAQLNAPPNAERTSYTGKQHDDQVALTYFGARWFDPDLGRFVSVDPIGFRNANTMSFNRYVYAYDNPYKYVDPDGKLAWFIPIYFGLAALLASNYAHTPTSATDIVPPGGASNMFAELALAGMRGPVGRGMTARHVLRPERVFTSPDPLVGQLATKIEAAYPGHVVGVNVPIRDSAGRLITEVDILLRNAAIQVKSGGGKGLTSQLARTEQATGLPAIGYGPNLKPSILQSCTATTCEKALIEVVKP
jgi:RHS repeat-associated protein